MPFFYNNFFRFSPETQETYKMCCGVDIQGDTVVSIKAEKKLNKILFSEIHGTDVERYPVAMAVTASESIFRKVVAPFSSFRKAKKILPTLLDLELPFAVEDCQVHFAGLSRASDGKIIASAVLMRKKDLAQKLDEWKSRGMDPVIVDQEGLALWDYCLREIPIASGRDKRIVIYAGRERCFVVVGCGTEISGIHAVSADFPSTDLKRILRIYSEEYSQKLLCLLVGPLADTEKYKNIPQEISDGAVIEVKIMPEPAKVLAKAIAMRGVTASQWNCNFRKDEFEHPFIARRNEKRFFISAGLLLLSAGILLVTALTGKIFIERKKQEMNKYIANMVDRLAGYHVEAKGEHALKIAKDAFKQKMDKMKVFLPDDDKVSLIIDIVNECYSSGVTIGTINLSTNVLEIYGTAPSWDAPQPLVLKLTKLRYKPNLERKEANLEYRIPFQITATKEK